MLLIKPAVRVDPAGSGHYHSKRGSRLHQGTDYVAMPNDVIVSPVDGVITKLGYCYSDDLSWRYVEVQCTEDKTRHRLFYTTPYNGLGLGSVVSKHQALAVAQDITKRYPGQSMVNHVHYEIQTEDRSSYLNPVEYHG